MTMPTDPTDVIKLELGAILLDQLTLYGTSLPGLQEGWCNLDSSSLRSGEWRQPFPPISEPAFESMPNILAPAEYVRLLHPEGREGDVTIGQKHWTNGSQKGHWRQYAVSVEELSKTASALTGAEDVYLTPNTFSGPRAINRLNQLCAAYSDLDYYKLPRWQQCSPEAVIKDMLDTLNAERVPHPSLVLFTGRGLLAIWLHSPQPPQVLAQWEALQNQISSVLTPYGSDPAARNAAMVVRLAGTINHKSGQMVCPLWPAVPASSLSRWSFNDLFEQAMPPDWRSPANGTGARLARAARENVGHRLRRETVTSPFTRKDTGSQLAGGHPHRPARWTDQSYWRVVLEDLHRLRRYRYPSGCLPPGHRNNWVFIAAVAVFWTSAPNTATSTVLELARKYAGWDEADVRSCFSSLQRKSERAALGEVGAFEGRTVDLRYRFKAETIVDWLAISEAEMREVDLRVLISPRIKKERATARQRLHRLQHRVEPRAVYEHKRRVKTLSKAEELLTLVTELGSVAALAAHLCIPVNTAKQRLKRAKKSIQGESTG